jgi:hypothetical protein
MPPGQKQAAPQSTAQTEQRPKKLLDQVWEVIRLKHYSLSTEEIYVAWIRRYILFHDKRHPREMGTAEVAAFLTHLAVDEWTSKNLPQVPLWEVFRSTLSS